MEKTIILPSYYGEEVEELCEIIKDKTDEELSLFFEDFNIFVSCSSGNLCVVSTTFLKHDFMAEFLCYGVACDMYKIELEKIIRIELKDLK